MTLTADRSVPTTVSHADRGAGPVTRPARVLTGDRPTGPLHLGHYVGTVASRVALQEQGHEVFLVVADYQVITDRDRPGEVRRRVLDLVIDYLACGMNPERTVIFAHSQVPELNQLMLPLLSLVTLAELTRNPTVKQEIALAGRSTVSGLMMTYPVHQAADILFCHAGLVPVGRDQLPHLEVTRSLARRFNQRYGPVLTCPEALLSETPLLLGLDGQKMGKSAGNAVSLRASDDEVRAGIRQARTDSQPEISFDPQHRPEIANLVTIAARCAGVTPERVVADTAAAGAAGLKDYVTEAVIEFLRPIRRRRAQYDDGDALTLLARGASTARTLATRTSDDVHAAMGMVYR